MQERQNFYNSNNSFIKSQNHYNVNQPNIQENQNFNQSAFSENDTEQEAINMINCQHEKIQELFHLLEQKNLEAENMTIQLNSMETYKIQIENFKRQVGILEEKLQIYEGEFSEKNKFLTEQLKNLSNSENKLRSQVISKDKTISEYENSNREIERNLNILKKNLIEKEKICEDYKQEFNEINKKFNNITHKFYQKEEELKNFTEEFEQKYSECFKEKNNFEEKMSQLIVIVKQYSAELAELNSKVNFLQNEKKNLKENNLNYEINLEKLCNENKNLTENLIQFDLVKNKLLEAENYLSNLENTCEKEKRKNENLYNTNIELKNKIDKIMHKYSGENSLENLKELINEKENDISNLKKTLENLSRINKQVDHKFCEVDAENKEILNGLNTEFKAIAQWIETYLCKYFEKDFDIPDLPTTISNYIKNKTSIGLVKENLNKARDKANKEFFKYENNFKEYKLDQNQFLIKQENSNCEISKLKNELLNKNEEIFLLKNRNEENNFNNNFLNEEINKIKLDFEEKQENYFKFVERIFSLLKFQIKEILANENLKKFFEIFYKKNFEENLEFELEENLEKILKFLNCIVKEYNYNLINSGNFEKIKKENENLKKNLYENDIYFKEEIGKVEYFHTKENDKNSLEKMKILLDEKTEENLKLRNENEILIGDINILQRNLSEMNNNESKENGFDLLKRNEILNESYKALEKKVKNMITEIELKNMQINSQEQMINRRTQEIQEIKNKFENSDKITNNNDIKDFNKEKLKQLEVNNL